MPSFNSGVHRVTLRMMNYTGLTQGVGFFEQPYDGGISLSEFGEYANTGLIMMGLAWRNGTVVMPGCSEFNIVNCEATLEADMNRSMFFFSVCLAGEDSVAQHATTRRKIFENLPQRICFAVYIGDQASNGAVTLL